MSDDIYKENGYDNRAHYLQCLASYFEAPLSSIQAVSDVLGAEEDFDGLVVALEDYFG